MSKQTNDEIIQEAKERFRRCSEWESTSRSHFIEDMRFGNGDCFNLWQYPEQVARARMQAEKPMLTINRTRAYCLQIINSARQDKSQIEIRPMGGGSSYKSSEIIEGIVRRIENQSNAQQAYDSAMWSAVFAGIGWWRVVCDYTGPESLEQDIYIRRVSDALSIYDDPACQEYDHSDSRFAFVYRDMDKDQFEKEYPKYKDAVSNSPLGEVVGFDDHQWIGKDRVRICEYYRKVEDSDTLHVMPDGSKIYESEVKDSVLRAHLKASAAGSRDVSKARIEWHLIVGSEIVEKRDWPGKYIPLVRMVGEETCIDGRMDRRGHVRMLRDPQMMYNWMASAGAEYVGLQSKTPWVAPVQAIEGYETDWAQANQQNLSILPYNHVNDAGQEIPKPEREPPPPYAPAYSEGMKIAQGDMQMASNQYESTMGEPSNERSGKAISERQRAGLTATYHFSDHQAVALRYTGKILLDLITNGKIYDTERVMKIMAIDGSQSTIHLDPNAPQAMQEVPMLDDESIDPQHVSAIFSPEIGEYDCVCDVGPSWASRRQEAFNALSDIMAQNESLSPMLMDIWAKNADFPEADVLAERFRRMLPPQATGKANPQVTQLQTLLQQQHQQMQEMQQELLQAKNRSSVQELQKEVEWYKAETDRLKAVGAIDPAALMPVVRQLVSEVIGTPVNPIIAQHVRENAAMLGQDPAAQQQQEMAQQAQQHGQDMQMQAQRHGQQMQQADQQHQQGLQQDQEQHEQQMQQMAAQPPSQ